MVIFFDIKKSRKPGRTQSAAVFFTFYIVVTIQAWLAIILSLDFVSILACVGYLLAIPLLPVMGVIMIIARKEHMRMIEYVNYAINLHRF